MAKRKGKGKGLYRDCRARAAIDLEGSGRAEAASGSGFLDHMLTSLARTANMDLMAEAEEGFWRVQALGEAIGLALDDALGDRSGICRYGSASVPMDEALADVALDFSGRPYLILSGEFRGERIGDFEVLLLGPFLEALSTAARLTVHIRFYGKNDHHKMECIFKALGLALRQAAAEGERGILSTKGVI
ncbi:MAG TPA: imidazoleglycerol-phosphate dehydratase [Methanothrix sp.]|jgi:imidazoleglycerol-phosphate dehydratase|uniref:imidazoleglycerol-phosphate dehydratase n=1 Tax=Methanothrix sp. TaxID=90426 RepID=UPI002B933392|nr:imidazoleglycerol-phosphate dehydratase [Methanothrix sp.]MDI9416413.1 imidazoleglycerol-phosphate dehydratase [Euryarchaeota archaeon]HON34774.1 imidazoleglycerol-phosphate dehydratase [Methanothrix sp.]HRU74631.1 imidazoleglycerol-phosphate dehydratase [Methanothrix sp.]